MYHGSERGKRRPSDCFELPLQDSAPVDLLPRVRHRQPLGLLHQRRQLLSRLSISKRQSSSNGLLILQHLLGWMSWMGNAPFQKTSSKPPCSRVGQCWQYSLASRSVPASSWSHLQLHEPCWPPRRLASALHQCSRPLLPLLLTMIAEELVRQRLLPTARSLELDSSGRDLLCLAWTAHFPVLLMLLLLLLASEMGEQLLQQQDRSSLVFGLQTGCCSRRLHRLPRSLLRKPQCLLSCTPSLAACNFKGLGVAGSQPRTSPLT